MPPLNLSRVISPSFFFLLILLSSRISRSLPPHLVFLFFIPLESSLSLIFRFVWSSFEVHYYFVFVFNLWIRSFSPPFSCSLSLSKTLFPTLLSSPLLSSGNLSLYALRWFSIFLAFSLFLSVSLHLKLLFSLSLSLANFLFFPIHPVLLFLMASSRFRPISLLNLFIITFFLSSLPSLSRYLAIFDFISLDSSLCLYSLSRLLHSIRHNFFSEIISPSIFQSRLHPPPYDLFLLTFWLFLFSSLLFSVSSFQHLLSPPNLPISSSMFSIFIIS